MEPVNSLVFVYFLFITLINQGRQGPASFGLETRPEREDSISWLGFPEHSGTRITMDI